jgi:hypothetical protein
VLKSPKFYADLRSEGLIQTNALKKDNRKDCISEVFGFVCKNIFGDYLFSKPFFNYFFISVNSIDSGF